MHHQTNQPLTTHEGKYTMQCIIVLTCFDHVEKTHACNISTYNSNKLIHHSSCSLNGVRVCCRPLNGPCNSVCVCVCVACVCVSGLAPCALNFVSWNIHFSRKHTVDETVDDFQCLFNLLLALTSNFLVTFHENCGIPTALECHSIRTNGGTRMVRRIFTLWIP